MQSWSASSFGISCVPAMSTTVGSSAPVCLHHVAWKRHAARRVEVKHLIEAEQWSDVLLIIIAFILATPSKPASMLPFPMEPSDATF